MVRSRSLRPRCRVPTVRGKFVDQTRFGVMTHMLSRIPSRRDVLHGFVGAGLGLGSLRLSNVAGAKKKRNKKKKKVTRNAFGCVEVGKFCKNSGQCCSGVCQGKKGKKKCQAHDASSCVAGEDVCDGLPVQCTTSTGDEEGICARTTGNASYCQRDGACRLCTKDADCVPFCGPQAACIVCETCAPTGFGTACVGPGDCVFPT